MKFNSVLLALVSGSLIHLTACGHVAHFFPDKERDYQHVKEIPLLNWPKDLRTPSTPRTVIPTPPLTAPAAADQTSSAPPASVPATTTPPLSEAALSAEYSQSADAPAYDVTPEAVAQPRPPADTDPIPDDTGDTKKPINIEQIKRQGSSRLRLNVGMLRAWRAIDKALSRNSIEVTERNQEEHRYTVQYDPHEKKAQDGSWLDEINFIFKGFEINEKTYRLRLVETHDSIEVELVNEQLKPATDTDASLKLLDVLEKTIRTDFTEAAK